MTIDYFVMEENKMFYNFKKNKKAFTLVELIVVIAIIAILGAVVGVTVSTFVDRARKSAATTPLTELASKWELKETGDNLQTYINRLFPDDYDHFFVPNANKDERSATSLSGDYTIYYHDDNCGDFYGTLAVVGGKLTAKSAVDTTKTPPSGLKAMAKVNV